jgi:hypothetical protein
MKPVPAPNVPGNTEAKRMSNALHLVLTVPKAILNAEAKSKEAKQRERKRKAE